MPISHAHPAPVLPAHGAPQAPTPGARPSRKGPRRGLSLALLIGLTLIAALVLGIGWLEWRGWAPLKGPVASYLSRKLNHDVHFGGGFEMHLWGGPHVRVEALSVDQPAWVTGSMAGEPMARADQFMLKVPFSTLLKAATARPLDTWRVDTIEVDGLQARLMRDETGRANWSLEPSGKAPVTPPGSKPATLPVVERLVVSKGRIVINDQALPLGLDASVSTTEGAMAPQGAGLVIQGKGRYKRYPFEVHASAAGVLPLLVNPSEAPPVPITIKAEAGPSRVNFEGTTRDLLSLGSLEGKLDLRGPSLAAIGDIAGVTLPTTARFSLAGHVTKQDNLWGMQVDDLRIGDSRLKGQFTFDRGVTPPMLKGELSGPRLALADLAPAFGAPADGAPRNSPPPSGHLLPQREFDVPSLRAMNAAVKVRLQSVTLGSLFAQPLQPLDADLQLTNGVLTIDNLVARTAGGNVGGSLKLDSAKKDNLLWDARLNWSGIKLENWLKPADKPGPAEDKEKPDAKEPYVSGELAGKANLKGEGNSTARLLGSLNGDSVVWVREGRVSRLMVEALSLHVAEALGLLITGDKLQPMQCAVARIDANQGVLTPQAAVVDTPSATILASGSVSLAKEQLDLMLTSKPKSFSPLSLRTPVDVKGTFADPKIGLHANPLSFKVISAAALATVAPLAAVIPLLDKGQKDASADACHQALEALKKR